MLNIGEYIEDYLMVYKYTSDIIEYTKINRIVINIDIMHKRMGADVYVIKDMNDVFEYEKVVKIYVDMTSDNFINFKREYLIDVVLSNRPDDLYSFYKNKLKNVNKYYYNILYKYIYPN